MTGSLITSIIPGAAGQGESRPAVRWGVVRARRRLPLGQLSTGRIGTSVYGVTALDSHGRIADRAVLRELGWTPGVRLEIAATRDLVTMRVHADGVAGGSGVTPQGHVRLPAPELPEQSGGLDASRWWYAMTVTETTGSGAAAEASVVEAARLLLERMGLRPEDLLAAPAPARTPAPTFADFIAVLVYASPPGTKVYRPYWKRVVAAWGQRRLDETTPSDIRAFIVAMKANDVVTTRVNYRGGVTAERHVVGAFRCLYAHAEADGLVTENPALKVRKPRRPASTRRALPDARLAEINHVVSTTGNDPELDALLHRFHVETACRRGGALALRPCDLDRQQCLVRLREKGETQRWQPVSPTLMRHLIAQVTERGAGLDARADAPLFRYRNGKPIGQRRYNYIWRRVGIHLPWAAAQGITAHWLRRTTLTWVERGFGYAVARAYAGHTGQGDAGTTTIYVKGTVEDGDLAALRTLLRATRPLTRYEPRGDERAWSAAERRLPRAGYLL